MTKRNLLYLLLLVLFIFSGSVLVTHYINAPARFSRSMSNYLLPVSIDGVITYVSPKGGETGLRPGDRIITVNGRENNAEVFAEENKKTTEFGESMNVTVERKNSEGGTQNIDAVLPAVPIERDSAFYLKQFAAFLSLYLLPTFSILLGFWVVLIRPTDYLAWLLLLLLMGVSVFGFEGYAIGTLVGTYREIFGSSWALSMLLFGIYFPERLSLDKRAPWVKWIFIIPLGLQVFLVLILQLRNLADIPLIEYFRPVTSLYGKIAMPLNMTAIGLFFACLGWKSGTMESPDARRRLRLMVIGTMTAMTPAFFIILYILFSRARGSFFDVAPGWLALLALLVTPLFPITMAYVIVVHRAMDVSVVVRQGLQYAFAKNGVLVVRILLSVLVILVTITLTSDATTRRPQRVMFIALGVTFIFLIRLFADRLKSWADRKFFREAYNSEQILSELSEDVRTMVETKPLLEMLSTRISESLHVPQIALLIKNGNSFQPVYALGYETPPVAEFASGDRTIEKLRKNEPIFIYQDDEDAWINEDEVDREKLRGLNTQLLLPVGVKNQLSGLISLGPKLSEQPYSANDLRLLKSVASQTGLALENSRLTEAVASEAAQKERLNRELEIAREVQERLFPQEMPKVAGIEYYGACRPALGVGGDYYDFIELDSGKFGIAIGDVSGKGIGASLMMASLQASLRGQAIHSGDDLAGLMVQVNRLVYEASTSDRYATFFYAQYDPLTHKMLYVNAGHNPPLLLRPKDGEIEVILLDEGGPVVGMLPPFLVKYAQGEIALRPGDMLVGSTDGITEAMNSKEEEWGEDKMLEELKLIQEFSPKGVLEHIVAAADRFADGAKQHDDMTMIVIQVI